jgi:hypothetical protein
VSAAGSRVSLPALRSSRCFSPRSALGRHIFTEVSAGAPRIHAASLITTELDHDRMITPHLLHRLHAWAHVKWCRAAVKRSRAVAAARHAGSRNLEELLNPGADRERATSRTLLSHYAEKISNRRSVAARDRPVRQSVTLVATREVSRVPGGKEIYTA